MAGTRNKQKTRTELPNRNQEATSEKKRGLSDEDNGGDSRGKV